MNKTQQVVVIEYLSNYKVKFTCTTKKIVDDEGGGWYYIVGYEPVCHSARIKHETQIPCTTIHPNQLTPENRVLFKREKDIFENSHMHKEWLKTFSKLLKIHI